MNPDPLPRREVRDGAVLRNEDAALLHGSGRFRDDLRLGQAYAVFVRATEAGAELRAVRTDRAAAAPGVVEVATAADLELRRLPAHASGMLPSVFDRPPLADGRVNFVGEPVAVVVADTAQNAVDAAELVEVDYGPPMAVTDPEAALHAGAPVLFPEHGSNVAFRVEHPDPGALDGAEVVVRGRFVNQRVAPAPMETNGALAVPEADGSLAVWASTQRVHALRDDVAHCLAIPTTAVRVVTPLVGGAFGGKYDTPVETVVVSAVARRIGRPVLWSETRSENLVAMAHGRGHVQRAELGVRGDGTIVGLRCEMVADAGGYPALGALVPGLAIRLLPWVYGIPRIDARGVSAITTTSTVGAYRGPGRAEVGALVERLVDMAAAELGIDPVEIRRRNLIPSDRFPFTTVTGMTYDVGDYRRTLEAATGLIELDELRAEQTRRRNAGDVRLLGVGVSMWLDITPSNRPGEYAAVDLRPAVDGDVAVTVRAGTCDQGQSHATTWGIILADVLGVPVERVSLEPADTATVPTGTGTGSARSLQVTGASVHAAAQQILEQAKAVAGHLLEAAPEDIVVSAHGTLAVAGSPTRGVSWGEVVAAAASGRLPDAIRTLLPSGGLGATADVEQPGPTFPSGTHVAVVEVDAETGSARVVRFVAVDDCGRVINPTVVAGQQQGGVAQGIGQALYEQISFDEHGTPRSSTLAEYLVPSAAELPPLEVSTVETRSPVNPLGAKGIGQGGAIGATVAVQNAVVDAVAHLGVRHIDLPCAPEQVWRAIRAAQTGRARWRRPAAGFNMTS